MRIDHRPFWRDDFKWSETAFIQGYLCPDKGAKHVKHHGMTYRQRSVVVERIFFCSACEINFRSMIFTIDTHCHADKFPIVQFIVILPAFERRNHAAHAFSGIVLNMHHVGLDHIQPELRDHLFDFAHTGFIGGNLGCKIGKVFINIPAGIGP